MKFKQLTPKDYPALKQFFYKQKHPLSAYTLASIIAWSNDFFQPCYVIHDQALVIGAEFSRRPANRHLLLPLAPEREFTPEELKKIAAHLGFVRYRFIPEDYLQAYAKSRIKSIFKIREQAEFADYVYRQEDLASLGGNKYAKKRNLIHQFKRAYDGRASVEDITPETASECIAFMEEWCATRRCEKEHDEELYCEKVAAGIALENVDQLEMTGLLIRVDGTVSAFALGARLTADTGALHFEKAFSAIKGLYQYLDNLSAQSLFNGVEFINKESDMNMPGLARAKKSYHPVRMVRSYELTLK